MTFCLYLGNEGTVGFPFLDFSSSPVHQDSLWAMFSGATVEEASLGCVQKVAGVRHGSNTLSK